MEAKFKFTFIVIKTNLIQRKELSALDMFFFSSCDINLPCLILIKFFSEFLQLQIKIYSVLKLDYILIIRNYYNTSILYNIIITEIYIP